MTLDTIFNHPNVGPFICRQLIQRLVTSNPTPGYVYRVSSVFNDNGQGVRGDLKAVVRAILMDYDARGSARTASKAKEPVKIPSHTARRRVIFLTIRLIILDPPCSFPTSVRIHEHPIPLVHVVLQEIRRKVTRKIAFAAVPCRAASLRSPDCAQADEAAKTIYAPL